ncbi:MAG: hypothetical protein MZV64_27985 [Ignavibacteriales bacterium]|nr:hypothetical protein [Ignavibacteriales bacterium]
MKALEPGDRRRLPPPGLRTAAEADLGRDRGHPHGGPAPERGGAQPQRGLAATTARAKTVSSDKIELTEIKRPATHVADPELLLPRPGAHLHGPGDALRLRQPVASRGTCRAAAAWAWRTTCSTAGREVPLGLRVDPRAEDRGGDRQAARSGSPIPPAPSTGSRCRRRRCAGGTLERPWGEL